MFFFFCSCTLEFHEEVGGFLFMEDGEAVKRTLREC